MPRLEALDPESQQFIRGYHCYAGDDPAWHVPARPLSECKVALITSSGLIRRGDRPFDLGNPDGDPSYRVIPSDTDAEALTLSIVSTNWDRSGFAMDVNTVFPIDRLRELADRGVIGSLAERFYAFMGSIFDIEPIRTGSGPEVGRMLEADGVDIAILVPV
jgi:D-proline reductase (dithiol) PrdB